MRASNVVGISNFDPDAIELAHSKYRSSKHIGATPMKTRCSGFLDREILIAGDVVFNDMHRLHRRNGTVRPERNG